jgi:hypothetical protein
MSPHVLVALLAALPLAQGKPAVEQEWAIADVLSDPDQYHRDDARCFMPGVAFRVWHEGAYEGENIDVLICFFCDNVYCGSPNGPERKTASFFGSPRRRDLVRLAKEAFPDDKDIQALKDE